MEKTVVQDEQNKELQFPNPNLSTYCANSQQNETQQELLKQVKENLEVSKQVFCNKSMIVNDLQSKIEATTQTFKYDMYWIEKIQEFLDKSNEKLRAFQMSVNELKRIEDIIQNEEETSNAQIEMINKRFELLKESNEAKTQQLNELFVTSLNEVNNEKMTRKILTKNVDNENRENCSKIRLIDVQLTEYKNKIIQLKNEFPSLNDENIIISAEIESSMRQIENVDEALKIQEENEGNERLNIQDEIKNLEELCAKNKNCIRQFEQQNENFEQQIIAEIDVNNTLKEEKSKTLKDYADVHQNWTSLNTEIQILEDIHTKSVQQYQSIICELNEEERNYNKQLDDFKNEIINKENSVSDFKSDLKCVESDISELEVIFNKQNKELTDILLLFENNKTNFRNEIMKLKNSIQNEKETELNRNQDIEMLNLEIKKLDGLLEDKENNCELKCSGLSINEDELNGELQKKTEAVKKLQAEIDEQQNKLNTLNDNFEKTLETIINNNEKQMQKIEEHNKVFKSETERLRLENEEIRKEELRVFVQNNSNIKSEIIELKAIKENYKAQLEFYFVQSQNSGQLNQNIVKSRDEPEHSSIVLKVDKGKIPDWNIPASKYSSMSSLSCSSISSINAPLVKEKHQSLVSKLKLQKSKTDKQNSSLSLLKINQPQDYNKLFDSLKNTDTTETKPSRSRNSRNKKL